MRVAFLAVGIAVGLVIAFLLVANVLRWFARRALNRQEETVWRATHRLAGSHRQVLVIRNHETELVGAVDRDADDYEEQLTALMQTARSRAVVLNRELN